jgi:glycerol kinase
VIAETTALGAAYAAGIAVGFWRDFGDVQRYWREDQRWTPNMPAATRDQQYTLWKKAVSRTLNWIEDAQ